MSVHSYTVHKFCQLLSILDFPAQSFIHLLRRRVAETELGYRLVAMPPKLDLESVSDR